MSTEAPCPVSNETLDILTDIGMHPLAKEDVAVVAAVVLHRLDAFDAFSYDVRVKGHHQNGVWREADQLVSVLPRATSAIYPSNLNHLEDAWSPGMRRDNLIGAAALIVSAIREHDKKHPQTPTKENE